MVNEASVKTFQAIITEYQSNFVHVQPSFMQTRLRCGTFISKWQIVCSPVWSMFFCSSSLRGGVWDFLRWHFNR